jgi:NhaA family Na+:H+ antiporter
VPGSLVGDVVIDPGGAPVTEPPLSHPPTWATSDGPVARTIAHPIRAFLRLEAAGGIVLLFATVAALAWTSSPWDAAYHRVWATDLHLSLGRWSTSHDLRQWIDDGAMALFFFVIGLEIKQELVAGRFRERRAALAPVAGALGGMVVPALLYTAINLDGGEPRGWAVPMATDVAFALGVMALLGARASADLKALLLGLAIVDDIGAVLVIALFYSDGIELGWLAAAVGGLLAVAVLQRMRVWWRPVYLVLGVGVWAATSASGVHATIAGVALGLLAPARPLLPDGGVRRLGQRLAATSADRPLDEDELHAAQTTLRESTSVAATLEHALHPWTALLVVPLFALANAGTPLSASALHGALTSRVGLGVALGLVVGKAVGVAGAIGLARRLGVATVADSIDGRQLLGMSAIAGIGFTVSLFVTQLGFDAADDRQRATTAILVASVAAAAIGAAILSGRSPRRR